MHAINEKTTDKLVGKKFGLLTVTKSLYEESDQRYRYSYLCKCDCGNEAIVSKSHLRHGKQRSCGCMNGEKFDPIKEIPSSQKHKRWKKSTNGLFLVSEVGDVYRIKGELLYQSSQVFSSRDKRYAVVTASTKNTEGKRKQKHFYVHRLVGELFVPNPECKPQINHIDGNTSNNHYSNLEWVTASENIQHAHDAGLIPNLKSHGKDCVKCGGLTMNEGVCSDCKIKMTSLKKSLTSKQNARNKIRKHFKNIHAYKPRYQRIIRARFQGLTLEEIGESLHITRERVRQLEKNVLNEKQGVFNFSKENRRHEKIKILLNGVSSIRQARIFANLRQRDIAEKMDISTATYNRYENYHAYMTIDKVYKFCEITGLNITEIDFIGSKQTA